MSADLLRRAAAKLREHAESCEPGPWTAVGTDGHGHELGHAWLNLPAYEHAWGMHGFTAEARYVALMHPPVALALAEWLEDAARSVDARIVAEQHVGLADGTIKTSDEDAALAVACAVLRESTEVSGDAA